MNNDWTDHESLSHIPDPEVAIAVVGMACRYPGAADLAAFWDLLRGGREAIRDYSDSELGEYVDAELLEDSRYVKTQALINNPDLFDAGLFGLTPKEAGLMDPQQRVFLEVVFTALEQAGLTGSQMPIGLFAGSDTNSYGDGLRNDAKLAEEAGELQLQIGNVKDHLTLRTSYLMNLRGPSVPVQTTCSTSLVAIHQAVQSLLNRECEAALAGGVAIPVPHPTGYRFEEGGALSSDGRCRAFDKDSDGTALGSGAGVVVLKRLERALEDGDSIHAVILGSAINNDGSDKAGYTAPSVSGQRAVISEAIGIAEVEASDIGYVEAHGTGTNLGDPIEIEALRQAFGPDVEAQQCAIGAVKTNIGHANSAAGVAGFIKTVLCVKHATLVPSLHFNEPNPGLDLANSPFYVNTETKPWESEARVAGVSSFGIGGTNAHAVLTQAPRTEPLAPARSAEPVLLSAASKSALQAQCDQLSAWLEAHPDAHLSNIAATLSTGRSTLPWRAAFAVQDCDELAAKLAKSGGKQVPANRQRLVFLFPGQGSDYERFGAELYQHESAFREAIDYCAERLQPQIGEDLRAYMFSQEPDARERLKQPDLWQPALFVSEYAAAQMWLSWGYRPTAMIGHSIGEYVAAVLAEVMTLDNALDLIAARGMGTKKLPTGAMMAAVLPAEKAEAFLSDDIDLAAINGPRLSVFSGTHKGVDGISAELKESGVQVFPLPATHAFHSHMMEPLMKTLDDMAASFDLKVPKIPMLSNVTGSWFGEAEVADSGYWGKHLRGTVRFNDGLDALSEMSDLAFVEIGPGRVLGGLVKRHPKLKRQTVVNTLDKAEIPDLISAYGGVGDLFKAGISPDWSTFYGSVQTRRVVLPAYPFERERYWLGKPRGTVVDDGVDTRREPHEWCYVPGWQQAEPMSRSAVTECLAEPKKWLVFTGQLGTTDELCARLETLNHRVIRIAMGDLFQGDLDNGFTLNPENPDEVAQLITALAEDDLLPDVVLHGWRLDRETMERDNIERLLRNGFDNVLHVARALAAALDGRRVQFTILTNGHYRFGNEETVYADKAALWGASWVIPKEFPAVRCRTIDLPAEPNVDDVDGLLAAAASAEAQPTMAFRYGQCWVFSGLRAQAPAAPQVFERGAVYLLTNGLREMGLELAEYLAAEYEATVVLTDRTFFPPSDEWDAWIAEQGEDDLVSQSLRRLQPLIAKHSNIHVRSANAAAPDRMRALQAEIANQFGAIHTVFHLDSLTRSGLIGGKSLDESSLILAAKLREALNVTSIFGEAKRFVFFAENPAEGGIGKVEQGAAYAFLDAYAGALHAPGRPVTTIDWGTLAWEESADDLSTMSPHIREQLASKRAEFGMPLNEARNTLARALDLSVPRVIVSTRDYNAVLAQQDLFDTDYFQSAGSDSDSHERPDLTSDYAEATNEVEGLLADIWANFFGLDKVGIHDNFFELGGHSLLAVQLLSKINETFASKMVLKHLFDAPTPAQLADLLADDGSSGGADSDVDALLAEIEGLSAEEIQRALQSEG